MNPAKTGPIEGAKRGPSEYIAIALALSRSENKSETQLPPMALFTVSLGHKESKKLAYRQPIPPIRLVQMLADESVASP